MNNMLLKVFVVVIMIPLSVHGMFAKNESSYLNFQIPHSLYKSGGYPHQVAHFGSNWGGNGNTHHADDGSMVQTLRMLSSSKTTTKNDNSSTTINFLCSWPNATIIATLQSPFVLLVDRGGGCTFVEKVRMAQKLGAAGVLIANNRCLCHEEHCKASDDDDDDDDDGETTTTTTTTTCDTHAPVVADDGSGNDVSIPSMLLHKSTADALKEVLHNEKKPILVEMRWQIPKFDDHVTMDFWYTPIDITSMYLMGNISKMVTLGFENNNNNNKLKFQPHYSLLNGLDYHCNGNAEKPEESCYDMCTNNGRYCSVSHQNVSGKLIVLESLRRMCIDKHYPTHIWDYLEHFNDWCHNKDYFGDENCLKDAYKHSKIEQEIIQTCFEDSGDPFKDHTNSMLAGAIELADDYGIHTTPTVLINKAPIAWGPLTPKTIFETLCYGFDHGKAPHACYECAACGDPMVCMMRRPMKCHTHDGEDHEEHHGTSGGKKKKGKGFKIFFFLALIAGGGGFVYYKKIMEDQDGMTGGRYSLAEAFMSESE